MVDKIKTDVHVTPQYFKGGKYIKPAQNAAKITPPEAGEMPSSQTEITVTQKMADATALIEQNSLLNATELAKILKATGTSRDILKQVALLQGKMDLYHIL